jgi:hypothetical protein
MSIDDICQSLKISRATLYRFLKIGAIVQPEVEPAEAGVIGQV